MSQTSVSGIAGITGSLGNFWGDYSGVEANDNFIGDTPYTVPTSGAQDNFPFCDDGDNIAPVVTITGLVDDHLYGGVAPSFGLTLVDGGIRGGRFTGFLR